MVLKVLEVPECPNVLANLLQNFAPRLVEATRDACSPLRGLGRTTSRRDPPIELTRRPSPFLKNHRFSREPEWRLPFTIKLRSNHPIKFCSRTTRSPKDEGRRSEQVCALPDSDSPRLGSLPRKDQPMQIVPSYLRKVVDKCDSGACECAAESAKPF